MKKFDNILLQCSSCNLKVIFGLIYDIECDWGSHIVIQCPNCEELFSIDNSCPAFSSILDLTKLNSDLLNQQEISDYSSSAHPC
ncbi:MAG: hypothetical protein K8Q89_08300 [Nitrosarchaeum sp.]|nr:hypothetical protein [Nitrosarchaeum sp.]